MCRADITGSSPVLGPTRYLYYYSIVYLVLYDFASLTFFVSSPVRSVSNGDGLNKENILVHLNIFSNKFIEFYPFDREYLRGSYLTS